MAISNRLLDYATWRRSQSFFSLNFRTLAVSDVQRVTVEEELGGLKWAQATHFGAGGAWRE